MLGGTIGLLAHAVDLSAVVPSCAAILDNSDHVSERCCTTRRVRVSGGARPELPRPLQNYHGHNQYIFVILMNRLNYLSGQF